MTGMLFPNLSVISTQYTKTVDGVKGALRISFAMLTQLALVISP